MRSESKRAAARRRKQSYKLTGCLLADPTRLTGLENLILAQRIGYHAGVLFRLREEVYDVGKYQPPKARRFGTRGRSRLWWARASGVLP